MFDKQNISKYMYLKEGMTYKNVNSYKMQKEIEHTSTTIDTYFWIKF